MKLSPFVRFEILMTVYKELCILGKDYVLSASNSHQFGVNCYFYLLSRSFHPEDDGKRFLQNAVTFLPD
jgi:hypothetical protein